MNKLWKGQGSVDVERERDFWDHTGPTDITVFEDLRIKSRAIGFVWPNEPEKRLIILEK